MKDASFYHFLLTVRGRPNEEGTFAEMVYDDLDFPKQESDFDKLSNYVETEGNYTLSMSVFDTLYEEFQEWRRF
ncbi:MULTISPECIES: YozE family protein [Staphylococcus]|uniref:YozE family protein n=1 Tax=Staphylococcus agnetis TaxID=985762 RepID=A0A2T4MIX8_9STAP|nr:MULTISPECIES: YozE family protein [Staphylococcus]ALN76414.1 YozE family protein [Staphylococcus agnetis]MDG4942456.1 YozE family protein [Staphylococcus agnetis]NHM93344.1 YozE family protein [Staphylococcus sp. 10602379]NJI03321.1 YozE family protein [Staphylococcus agnetis]NJI13985.1 YozE family protein [Staphylococcus agnetis]